MPRTAPVPNMIAIPGMNPGLFVLGGGGDGGGSGAGAGNGKGGKQGADGKNGGKDAQGGGKGACGQGAGSDGGACPNNHGDAGSTSGGQSQGDPVDMVSGEVFVPAILDVRLPGPMPLEITRSYRSSGVELNVGLGFGWTHGLSWSVERRRRSTLLRALDGLTVDFGRVEPGAANLGPHGWLLHRDGEAFVLDLTDARSLRFELDPADPTAQIYRLALVSDRSGNRISVEYDGPRLARITDSAGRVVHVRYTASGRIAAWEMTLAGGEPFVFARYRYDAPGNLVEAADAEGHVTTYAYDAEHRLIERRHPTGITFRYRYDSAGRCVETWGERDGADPCLADGLPDVLADGVTRAKGVHHVVLEYGPDRFTQAIDAVTIHRSQGNAFGKVDKAACAGAVFSRSYDAHGYITEFIDPTGAVTRYERDLWGNATKVIDPLGHVTAMERDAAGDLLRVIDPEGGVTEVHRTARTLQWADPSGATYEVRYDARGLPAEVIAPGGYVRKHVHDPQGNLIEVRGALGGSWTATYDELGRRRSITKPDGATTRFHYDRRGLLIAVEEPTGAVLHYGYDGDGQLVSITDADGGVSRLVRGGSGVVADAHLADGTVVRFRYDRMERLVAVVNAKGEAHTFEHDAFGVVTRERTFDGRALRYEHDAAGRVLRATGGAESVAYERDALGRVVKKIYEDDTEETFEHNARSEIVRAAGPGVEVTFDRDALGRITRETTTAFGRSYSVHTDHDALDSVVWQRTSDGHVLEWAYDGATRKLTARLDGAAITTSHDAGGFEVRTELPGGGRIDVQVNAEGRTVARTVLPAGAGAGAGPSEPAWVGAAPAGAVIHQRYGFTPSGSLGTVWDAQRGLTELRHDPLGQLTASIPREAAGRLLQFGYDAAGNLAEIAPGAERRSYGPGGRLLTKGDSLFVWDERGCLAERRDSAGHPEERVTRYHFDGRGLLAAVDLPDGRRVEQAHDPFARRVRKVVLEGTGTERRVVSDTRFFWDGNTLIGEATIDAQGEERSCFYYTDMLGVPRAHRVRRDAAGVIAEEPWRYYVTDPQTGYPERLLDDAGRVVASLSHDPWGRLEEGSDRAATPLRFAGQYEDVETGLFYNRHRYYAPDLGVYLSPDPLGLVGGPLAYAYAGNQPDLLVDPWGLIYSEISDPGPPPKTYKGWNPSEGGTTTPHPWISDKPCAEAQALTHMANDIKEQIKQEQKSVPIKQRLDEEGLNAETKKRMKGKFDNGAQIETWDQENAKRRKRVDPCKKCGKMFETLEITGGVVGAKGKKGSYGVYAK